MTRTEYMRAVYATDLDPESKAILVYFGFCKNWKEGTLAFPSYARVAKDTGLSWTTVKRRVPVLRAQGYLSDTGRRKGNGVVVYDLLDPTGISQTTVQATPIDTTVVSQTSNRGLSDHDHGLSDHEPVSQRPLEQVHNKLEEQVQEQVPTSPVSDEPVAVGDSPNLEVKEEVEEVNHWLFLDREEKRRFLNSKEQYKISEDSFNEAVRLYRVGGLRGSSWYEVMDLALIKVGVEIEEW